MGMEGGGDVSYSAHHFVHCHAKAAAVGGCCPSVLPGGAAVGTDRLRSSGSRGWTGADPRVHIHMLAFQ